MALAQINCPPDVVAIPTDEASTIVDPRQVTVIDVLKALELISLRLGVPVPQIIVSPVGILTVVHDLSASALNMAHYFTKPTALPTFDLALPNCE